MRFSSVLNSKFPNLSVVHIFASVPIPVAFVLGHKIQPNIYPVLYTYQFKSNAETQFQLAIIINQPAEKKECLQPNNMSRQVNSGRVGTRC